MGKRRGIGGWRRKEKRRKKKKTEKKKGPIYRGAEEKTSPSVQERLPVLEEVINHVLEVKHTLMCLAKLGYRRKLRSELNILILFPKASSCL